MHLYSHYWKMLRENKSGIIIYGMIMIIMATIIGMSATIVKGGDSAEKLTESIKISYVDNDKSKLSQGLIDYLAVDNTLSDYGDKTDEEINDIVYFSISEFHIYIPEGFMDSVNEGSENAIEYVTGAGESSYAYTISNAIDSYLQLYSKYRSLGYTEENAIEKAREQMTKKIDISVYHASNNSSEGKSLEWCIYQVVIYLPYLTLGMIMVSVGNVILKSGEENVRKRIISGPISPERLTVSDTLGLYTFGAIVWAIATIVLCIVGRNTTLIRERGFLICAGLLVIILCNCSITAFVTSFKLKTNALSMLANVVGLSMSFLTGVFVPQWLLGEEVLSIGRTLPFYWYVRALNIMYPECGAGLSYDFKEIGLCFGVVLLFALAFSLLSVLVRKTRKA